MERKIKDLLPAKFDVKDHLSVPEEAERFQLPEQTIERIAGEVQKESGGGEVLISKRWRENEARDKFRQLYNLEVQRRAVCAYGCTVDGTPEGEPLKFRYIEELIAHLRVQHHINQVNDPKLSRSATLDLEAQVWPKVEKEISAALSAGERRKIAEDLEVHRVLSFPEERSDDDELSEGDADEEPEPKKPLDA